MTRLMTLVLRVRDGTALVRFNDIPLLQATPHHPLAGAGIHEYVIQGKNRLSLEWLSLPSAPNARVHGMPLASARVLLADHGAPLTPASSLTLMACDLSAGPAGWNDADRPPLAAPACEQVLPSTFPRWAWQDASRRRVKPRHILSAHALMMTLTLALRAGDTTTLHDLLARRDRELARAYAGPTRSHPPPAPDGMQWQCPALDDFLLLPQANGRLHQPMDRQGRAALACIDAQGRRHGEWPLRLASIDHRWIVAR